MRKEMLKIIGTGTIYLSVIVVLLIGYSWQEAKIFNKYTGSDVTTFDAIFVQLRLVEPLNRETQEK